MDQKTLDEVAKIGGQHVDVLLQIFSGDDGGFFITGGGIRLGARSLQELKDATCNILDAVYGKCNQNTSQNFQKPMDN